MSTNAYESPFSSRYASEEMQYVFSQDNKFKTWRKLWIALAKAEKALGINITDEQIAELIGETYEAHTPRTLTTLDDLYDELEQVRREGIAHDYGEITAAIECLAAPVRIDGKVRYGLGISVPSYRLTPEKRLELTELLRSSSDYLEVVLSQ